MEQKKTLTETKQVSKKGELKDVPEMKILGVVQNFGNERDDYYVGFDGKNYFLMLGRRCTPASETYPFLNQDQDWPDPSIDF